MSSIYWQILTEVQTLVKVVVPNCLLRRKLFRLEGDTFPLVIVAPQLPPGEHIANNVFNKNVIYSYPVMVVYVCAGAKDLTTGLQSFLDTREAIRQALYQPLLSNVAAVWSTTFEPEESLKFGEFLGTAFDVSGIVLHYKSKEVRVN